MGWTTPCWTEGPPIARLSCQLGTAGVRAEWLLERILLHLVATHQIRIDIIDDEYVVMRSVGLAGPAVESTV